MSRRHTNKLASRLTHGLRRELVHAAGCMFTGEWRCAYLQAIDHGELVECHLDEFRRLGVTVRPVSVPRSLRAKLGRYVGGPNA